MKTAHVSRRGFLAGAGIGAASILAAACGVQPAAAPAEDQMAAKTDEPKAMMEPGAVEGVVTVWSPTKYDFGTDTGGEISNAFREEYGGNVRVVGSTPASLWNTVMTAAAAGASPDVASGGDWFSPEWGLTGVATDLLPRVKASNVDMSAFWESLFQENYWDGKLYGFSYSPDLRVMFIRSESYLEAGLDPENPPQYWDEMEEVVVKTSKQDAGGKLTVSGYAPFWGSGGHNEWIVPLTQLGGSRFSDDRWTVTINSPEAVEALTWLKKIFDLQGGWDNVKQLRGQGIRSNVHFKDGRIANYWATYAERGEWLRVNAPELTYHFMTYPRPRSTDKHATWGGTHTWHIGNSASNPDGGWAFIEFGARREWNLKFAKRYDRIPIRIDVTHSEEFHENDPFLLTQNAMIPHRVGNVGIPGAEALRRRWRIPLVDDVTSGKLTPQEGLAAAEHDMQAILDEWKARIDG